MATFYPLCEGRVWIYIFFATFAFFCFAASRGDTVVTVEPGAERASNLSLEHHLCYASDQMESNTEIILSPGTHSVDQGDPCIITNINNLTIRGAPSGDGERGDMQAVEIVCSSNIIGRNFIFLNVTNLRVENIIVRNCGRELPSDLPSYVNSSNIFFGSGQKGVFLFGQISNLILDHVTIDRCFGYGFIGVNLDGDTVLHSVTITNTDNFQHLKCIVQVSDLSCSGSGAVFLYADPAPGERERADTTFTVTNSTFELNENRIPFFYFLKVFSSVRSSYQTERLVLTGGSGLAFYTQQRSYHVSVEITGSKFAYNDGYSGALVMIAYNTIREVSIRVSECDFIGNIGRFQSRGGGMILLQVNYIDALQTFPSYPNDVYEILKVSRCNFIENEAEYGGAAYIHPTPQNISDIRVVFDNVTFTGNIARSGSAIASVTIQSTFVTRSLHILLEDVEVRNNTFQSALYTTTSTIDNSAILLFVIVQNVTITGRDSTHGSTFFNNNPGVILASGSNVYLKGYLKFYDNFAFRGGAIAMIDYSILFFHEGSKIKFSRNRALANGGAIYADSLGTLDACVIQFIGPSRISTVEEIPSLNLSIKFENNIAGDSGNSIYANPIYDCAYLPEASLFESNQFITNPGTIYADIFHFSSSVNNGVQELSSRPERLCFCNGTEFNMEFCIGDLRTAVSAIPGEEFTMYLVPVDKISNPVSSILFAEFNTPELQLSSTQTTQRLTGRNCDPVNFQAHGLENGNGNLNLYAVLGGLAITVDVTLEKCPPGFSIGSQRGLLKCVCDSYVTDGLLTSCNTTSYTIARPGNAWLGAIEHINASDFIFVSTCPVDHCNEEITDIDLRVADQLCQPGRTGQLCGGCQPGLSIVFGSNECKECSNYWIFTILLYAILGIVLVVILFLLNLTVTQGTVVGLIFYANIVSVNINIFNHNRAQNFVFVFISLINLELGFPLCFFDGMTEVMKVGFQFIFPAYLLALSVGIIFLVRWSSRMQKLTASNGIHVLATLLYLSYAKILRTVIDSLSIVTIRSEAKEHVIWLYDGNLEYFTSGHIALVIVSVVVLLFFLAPYTIVLLFIKQFQRYITFRLKPILDAYGGPYKDRYVFWVGLRLFTLAIMCSTYAVSGVDNPSLALMIQLIFITFFHFWQALCKPFKNYFIELLDLFFTMNFIMMAIASLHVLNVDIAKSAHKQKAVVDVLISLVFIVFCGIIAFHVVKAFHRIQKVGEKMDHLWTVILNWSVYRVIKRKVKGEKSPPQQEEKLVALMGMKTLERTTDTTQTTVSLDTAEPPPEEDNVYRTRKLTKADFSQLREPVLDD